jgi:GAF domain-containing protein
MSSHAPGRPPLVTGLRRTLALAARQLGMEASVLGEVTHGREVVRRVAGAAAALGITEGVGAPLADTYCLQLLEGRMPPAVPDTLREPAVAELPATRELGIRSYIGVPLRLEDARLYVLCCLSRERRPTLGDDEVTFLRGVAESIRGQLDG